MGTPTDKTGNPQVLCSCQFCTTPGGVSVGISPDAYDGFMRNICRRCALRRAVEKALADNGTATARLPATRHEPAATLEVRIKP